MKCSRMFRIMFEGAYKESTAEEIKLKEVNRGTFERWNQFNHQQLDHKSFKKLTKEEIIEDALFCDRINTREYLKQLFWTLSERISCTEYTTTCQILGPVLFDKFQKYLPSWHPRYWLITADNRTDESIINKIKNLFTKKSQAEQEIAIKVEYFEYIRNHNPYLHRKVVNLLS